jgi:acyl-CoA thioesterase
MTRTPVGPHPRSPVDGTPVRDPTSQALGIEIDEIGRGRARLRMRVTAAMANGHGTAHGGYLFLLADAAFAYASNSTYASDAAYASDTAGPVAVAQQAQITFLQPVAVGTALRAEAVERARYGRFGLYDVTVRREDGEVVAEFRGHSVLLAAGSRPATSQSIDNHLK